MAEFDKDQLDSFLGVVRKYMQVRGPMSQKELAELTEVGVSTMSRFLNQKTTDLNPQLIAKIVAKLNIPLHEIIDFVDEDFTDRFVRLVKFFRADVEEEPATADVGKVSGGAGGDRGGSYRTVQANVSSGGGRRHGLVFGSDDSEELAERLFKEHFRSLTPRQRAYMTDFFNLDMEARDLMVDIGNDLIRYFRQKGMII